MIPLLLAAVLGAVVVAVLERTTRATFAGELFRRTNYRGAELSTAVGVLIPCGLLAAGSVAAFLSTLRPTHGQFLVDSWQLAVPTLLIATGFALLGLLDDLGGMGQHGGFTGHIRSLLRGEVSTGMIKLLGGPFFAILAVRQIFPMTSWGWLLVDGAIVALGANTANLFDRAPGRVNKVAQLCGACLLVASRNDILAPVAAVLGGAAALLRADLKERLMLGDAGSNTLGAVLGFGVVIVGSDPQKWILLVVLVLLNLASERVSFSAIIEKITVLRYLDRLGATHRNALSSEPLA